MTTEEYEAHCDRLRPLLFRYGLQLQTHIAAIHRAETIPNVEIVVPESFPDEVVTGSTFLGRPLVRGPVEAPMARQRDWAASPDPATRRLDPFHT